MTFPAFSIRYLPIRIAQAFGRLYIAKSVFHKTGNQMKLAILSLCECRDVTT